MAFIFADGFDHYTAVGVTGANVAKYLQEAGYTIFNAAAGTLAVRDGRRAGAKCIEFNINSGSSVNARASYTINSAENLQVFGFAFKATGSRLRICRIENVVDVEWDVATGKLSVDGVLGASVLILNAWYYFEIEIDHVANEVRVWANNELQVTVTPASALPSVFTIVWGFQGTAPSAAVQQVDDFYVLDSGTGLRTARLQPIEVTTRAPTTDITAEWDVVDAPALTPHYEIVSQLSPGDAGKPYLQSNTAGAQDVYRSSAVLPTANTVFAVSVLAYARKGDLDARSIGLYVDVDGGSNDEVQIPLTESYKYYQANFEAPPGGGSWTQNNVESLNFGIITR